MKHCRFCGQLVWWFQDSKLDRSVHLGCWLANKDRRNANTVPLLHPVPPRPKRVFGGGMNTVPLTRPIPPRPKVV